MATKFFNNFPLIGYSLDENALQGDYVLVTNIFRRIKIKSEILNKAKVYYPYFIKDGDTPENIAHRYYGSVDFYWIILLCNNIIDPVRSWPKNYISFLNYINDAYGTIPLAQTTIHHYEKIISKVNSNGESSEETFIVDKTEYDTLVNMVPEVYTFPNGYTVTVTTTRKSIDCYTYEDLENEKKRSIVLLKDTYVPQIKKELEALLVG